MQTDHISIKRIILLLAGIAIAVLVLATQSMAQSSSGFLYGKVYTNSNVYEGQIRWGDEEAYWVDFFNAAKKSSSGYEKLKSNETKDDDSWTNLDWDLLSIWENKSTLHQFGCQFGDIKSLEILNNNNVRLRFKNGMQIEVNGDGYNDINTKIQVLDKDLGWTSLKWEKVTKVEFSSIPVGTSILATQPLYGIVETNRNERFQGFIQWDHDERVGSDKLDGDSDDGKVAIAFSEIASIEKRGGGSEVAFKSGKQVHLTGSNDVDSDNRGIIVLQPGKGMIDIPWSSFRKVTFDKAPNSGPTYESFVSPKPLVGKVILFDGNNISGTMIFDLDETLDVETLEGKDNEIEYTIPFRNIKSIKPKNADYSIVELKNGETLLLGEGRDVSENNDGVIILIKGQKQPKHLRWRNIEQIIFN